MKHGRKQLFAQLNGATKFFQSAQLMADKLTAPPVDAFAGDYPEDMYTNLDALIAEDNRELRRLEAKQAAQDSQTSSAASSPVNTAPDMEMPAFSPARPA